MSGTNTTPKKRSFGFDDILSILDGKKTRPPARPALPPSTEPEIEAAPAVETREPPKVIALPEDHNLVPKLLADIDQKNSEIIRLNNDVVGLRYEIREKEFVNNSLTLDNANKDLRIKELQVSIDELKAEIATLKAIRPQQPVTFTPAQPPVAADPVSEPVPQQPLQITQLLDAVQAAKAARQPAGQETSTPVQADAAGARPIAEQYNIKEEVVEEDVATIFRRLARSHDDVPAESGNVSDVPRRPRLAKLYDL